MEEKKELQEALYELCQATLKVMRIAYRGAIPTELVSDAVKTTLQHLVNITDDIQNTSTVNSTNYGQEKVENNRHFEQTPNCLDVDTLSKSHTSKEIVYGHNPISRGGQYVWSRLSTDSEEQRYKITKYSDGTAEFELITISGDKLNAAWSSRGDSLPKNVVTVNGDFKDGGALTTTQPGKGQIQGRTIIVLSPCIAEFK